MTTPTPTYGSQVQGGGIAVFDPNTGKALAGAGQYNPNTGLKIQQTPINASIIGNTTPLQIPQVNNTQAQTALGITANAAAQPENNQIIEPQPVEQTQSQSISEQIKNLIGLQGTQGAVTAQLQNEQGLTQKQQAVNDINTKITTTKKAYEDQIKEIRKNSEGKFAGAVEQDINNLTRVANEDLANLAIVQAGAVGNLQTAQEIVDTKIKAEFEPIQNQIASYTQLYNLVQNDLTESEKLAVQEQINEKNNAMQTLMDAKKQAYDTALQNGAPANVLKSIGEAVTPDMAYQAVGQYGVNQLDKQLQQAQLANIYSQINERNNPTNPEGTLNGKPQNATQSAANSYADRLSEANVIIDTLGGKFTGKLSQLPNFNFMKSSDRQSFEQAQKNFITAILRRESGAAISDSEFKTAAQLYFPQPGDSETTVAQKAKTRNTAINNFYREANVPRPVLPGQIIESGGKKYKVGLDGVTLEQIK